MSSANALKRIINKDIKEISNQKLNSNGIYVYFNEDNMLNAKAMIAYHSLYILRHMRPNRPCDCILDYWQEASAPRRGSWLWQTAATWIVHHHKTWQILILASKAICYPGTYTGKSHPRHPGVHLKLSRWMIIFVGETRIHKRHIVHMGRQVWKEFWTPSPILTMLIKTKWRLEDRTTRSGKKTGTLVESSQRLTVASGKLRLVVPCINVAGRPVHEQPDHRPRLAGIVRRTNCKWLRGVNAWRQACLWRKHGR